MVEVYTTLLGWSHMGHCIDAVTFGNDILLLRNKVIPDQRRSDICMKVTAGKDPRNSIMQDRQCSTQQNHRNLNPCEQHAHEGGEG
jgi:hypothetical protein